VPTLGSGKFDIDDLDGDGKPDIISVTHQAYLDLRKNLSSPGAIQFSSQMILKSPGSTGDVKISDVDGDGRNDIIVGLGSSTQGIGIYKNTSVPGYISFGAPKVILNGTGAGAIAVGDLDGDGKNDIVSYIGNGQSTSQISVLHNSSSPGVISFDPHVDLAVAGSGSQTTSIILADMDNDGKLDLNFANDNKYYCLFRNTSSPGSISFDPPMYYASTNIAQGPTVGDLNGDSKPDYAATGGAVNGSFSVMRNTSLPGSIHFDNLVALPNNPDFYYTNTGDFNADGKTDIVVSNPSLNEFAIYKNNVGDSIHFTLCESFGSQIDADLNGTLFQWQQFNGTSFVNIPDDSNISATNSSSLYFSRIPFSWNGRIFRCLVDSQYSSIYVMKVNPAIKPIITVTSSDSLICFGSAVTFTASILNQGIYPRITWQLNGSDIGPDSNHLVLSNLKEGDLVRAILGSNNSCFYYQTDTSNTFIIHLKGTKPSVVIQTSDTSICEGANVIFKVTPVTGIGLTPTYDWKINGNYVGQNLDSLPNQIIANGDQVSVVFSSTTGCIIPTVSNTINMTVNPSQTPAVIVSSSADSVCKGKIVYFIAIASDTGAVVTYQWQKNGLPVGISNFYYSDSSLNNLDVLSVLISTNPRCALATTAQSNEKKIVVVSALDIPGTISGNSTLLSGNSTSLTATLNANATPVVYSWQDSTANHNWQEIIGNSAGILNYKPKNTGDEVKCIFSYTNICQGFVTDTSNYISFTVLSNQVVDSNSHINFYPNPVSNLLFIDSLNPNDQWQSLEIYNGVGGRILLNQQIQNQIRVTVDVSAFEPGVYICVLRRKALGPSIFKIIKL